MHYISTHKDLIPILRVKTTVVEVYSHALESYVNVSKAALLASLKADAEFGYAQVEWDNELNIVTIGQEKMMGRQMETLKDRYDIYVSCMEGSGEYIKTFDEWLAG